MAVDKLVDSTQLDADLTSVANAIRTKGGTSASLAFPADFVSAIAAIPSGGGGTAESGSFIASAPLDSVTISVTSQKSHVLFWIHGFTGDMDLSGAPYGTNKLIYFEAHADLRACVQGQVNYAGTALSGGFGVMNIPGGAIPNNVEFASNSITIAAIRVGGSNRPMVDGATYDWEAW